MKYIFTFCVLTFSLFSYGQSKMETPTKVTTINNSGNKIEPIKTSKVVKTSASINPKEIRKNEFKTHPKEKQKLIKKQPEKYIIID